MPRYKDASGCYNKHDARELGLATAVVWNDIIDRSEQFDTQKIWYDQKMASERLGIPQQTISRCLKTLEEVGRVSIEGGYRPKSTVRTTWVTVADEYLDDNLITQNGYPKVTQNEYPILKETKERDSLEDTQTGGGMKVEALYSRVHSMFKGPNEMRKQKIESLKSLREDFQLSDDTILNGFRAIADNPTFTTKEGDTITWTLSMLLLRNELEKTARLLVQKAEQVNKAPGKVKGLEHFVKFGDF